MNVRNRASISGNMFIYILGAIFLLGLLIVIIKGNVQEGSGIDGEKVTLAAGEVQKQAGEFERAVNYILRDGVSESDIRFAHPDALLAYGDITLLPRNQVFDVTGGGAEYESPPAGVNDGTAWQFFGNTHITDLGTDEDTTKKAELLAVLPNVTEAFCARINFINQQSIDLEVDTDLAADGCIYAAGDEFAGTFTDEAGANALESTLFTKHPAKEACVRCDDDSLHYYRVLHVR